VSLRDEALRRIADSPADADPRDVADIARELVNAREACRLAADLERAWARSDVTFDNVDDDFMADLASALTRWKRAG
jgi:hypothetical protein